MADVRSRLPGPRPDGEREGDADGATAEGRGHRRRARDRGQLFLVGALALATVFVVLAVLLNSAIYTESVATRGDGTGSGAAIEYERAAVDAVADAMAEAGPADTTGSAADAVANRTGRWRAVADHHVSTDAAVGDVRIASTTAGTYLADDNASRPLTNASGDADWTVVEGAAVRAYDLRLRPTAELTDATVGDRTTLLDAAFHAEFENASGTWTVAVFRNDGEVCARTYRPDDTEAGTTCVVDPGPGERVAVSVTGASVGGTDAPGMAFLTAGEAYDVRYRDGDAAEGTFDAVARVSPSAFAGSAAAAEYAGRDAASSPFYSGAVYEATVDVSYRSANVRYGDSVRVAPGEPDA
ncbi:hypothetical protein [Halobaculum lipolyticum]|uniref:Flagellin n=1 Tax=Halobaculum lipolyticum TaxID=3032001 RepID=A0ABD5WAF5_9EURY|nr:hypothetical protein [Halobaculum sp. DT31]